MRLWLARFAFVALALTSGGSSTAYGDDFRIHSRVFAGDESEPITENITIFLAGRVYDVAVNTKEVVVFDTREGRFILLNPKQKHRAEITIPQIEGNVQQLNQQLRSRDDVRRRFGELVEFLARPDFKIEAEDGVVTFRSKWMVYRVKTVDVNNDKANSQFADFLDWYTRFNALENPSRLARLPINQWLKHQRQMPEWIKLTTYTQGPLGRMKEQDTYRSEHNLTWKLSKRDRERIDQVAGWLVTFDAVDLSAYRKGLIDGDSVKRPNEANP